MSQAAAQDGSAEKAPEADRAEQMTAKVTVGFAGTFRVGTWTPFDVVLDNHGAAFHGVVELAVTGGNELTGDVFRTTHQGAIELARGGRKRVRFIAFIERVSSPVRLTVRQGESVRLRRTLNLRPHFTERALVVAVGREVDLDYMNQLADPSTTGTRESAPGSGESLRVLYPHPLLLPEHWLGYDAVRLVVVHGLSLSELSERQHQALVKWIHRGGTLVVSGGPDYQQLRGARLAALLPATVGPLRRFSDRGALARGLGGPINVREGVDVNRMSQIRGVVLRAAAGADVQSLPLILARQHGRGRVIQFAFDLARYPFDRWSGMGALWREILDEVTPLGPAEVEPYEAREPVVRLLRDAGRRFPSHAVLVAFLVGYLAVLASLRALTGRARRPGVAMATATWVSAIGFALGGWYLFSRLLFTAGPSVVTTSVIEPFGNGPYASARHDVALFAVTDPSRGGFAAWGYAGRSPAFWPALPILGAQRRPDWTHRRDARHSVGIDAPRTYHVYRLHGEDVIHFELDGQVRETRDGFEVQIRNFAGSRFTRAWLLIGNRAFALGTVAAGRESHYTLDHDAGVLLRTARSWGWMVNHGTTPERYQLLEEVMLDKVMEARYPSRSNEAVLVGFMGSPLIDPAPRDGPVVWASSGHALAVRHLPRRRSDELLRRDLPEIDLRASEEL